MTFRLVTEDGDLLVTDTGDTFVWVKADAITETLSLSDTLTAQTGFSGDITEPLELSDSYETVTDLAGFLTDSFTLTDTLGPAVLDHTDALTETLVLTDTMAGAISLTAVLIETLLFRDHFASPDSLGATPNPPILRIEALWTQTVSLRGRSQRPIGDSP